MVAGASGAVYNTGNDGMGEIGGSNDSEEGRVRDRGVKDSGACKFVSGEAGDGEVQSGT